MSSEILGFTAALIRKAERVNLKLINEKEIGYGVQLQFEKNGDKIPVNIYYSKKKGISCVIGGSPKNGLRPILQGILGKPDEKISQEDHSWKKWAGTDESGKGDFFGALVVCGFIVEDVDVENLKKLGVKDCKLLKDDELQKVAKRLYRDYAKNIEVLMLVPSKYNDLYEKFRNNNKKLNEMLAWMHARVILNLQEKHEFEGAVVDKFASDKTLMDSLKDMKEMSLLHKIKAEEDIAVAAASIIARYHFLNSLQTISRKFNLVFPKGASKKVIEIGKEFSEKFGKDRMSEVAKTHFKTLDKI
ncbi:MAG: ribonuclease HIII [Candidatus Cloacimonetes bacterium]|nr:ribonuclease HIII [Candidatus Cloacimonadota bacterium]